MGSSRRRKYNWTEKEDIQKAINILQAEQFYIYVLVEQEPLEVEDTFQEDIMAEVLDLHIDLIMELLQQEQDILEEVLHI